jgi:diphthamide synthase (EF-2-diphthine--ammonia ligase)
VDPCGENGEFHTFVFDGPIFAKPIAFEIGELVYRNFPNPKSSIDEVGFWYIDLIPK